MGAAVGLQFREILATIVAIGYRMIIILASRWGQQNQLQGRLLWQKTCQALKTFAWKDAIFLQITAGRRKMGPGIANPVPVIVKITATAIK